jgi:hypothetical protein
MSSNRVGCVPEMLLWRGLKNMLSFNAGNFYSKSEGLITNMAKLTLIEILSNKLGIDPVLKK